MDRRNFLKNTCGACVSIGIGSLFVSSILDSCKTPSLSIYKTEATKNNISIPVNMFDSNDFKMIRINNYMYDVAVIKKSQNNYLALLLMCTHAGQALTKAGNGYLCPLHGSKFSETGEVVKGPAAEPLKHLPININGQTLLIKLDDAYFS